jgi:1,4-alpha-glucan branching enzyme
MNFDAAQNHGVREYFIQNAIFWFEHYHVDGLRLDAIQAIYDRSAYPFLAELSDRVKRYSWRRGRSCFLKGGIPDPASSHVFTRSCLHWGDRHQGKHKLLLRFYQKLIKLRKEITSSGAARQKPVCAGYSRESNVITLHWRVRQREFYTFFHCCNQSGFWQARFPGGQWVKRLDTADTIWGGQGSKLPHRFSGEKIFQLTAYQTAVYVRRA